MDPDQPDAAPFPPLPEAVAQHLRAGTPQKAFPWNRQTWENRLGHFPAVDAALQRVPDKVDRDSTRLLVRQLLPGNVSGAFAVAMVWGYGTTGYGPVRTRWVLTGTRSPGAPLDPSVGDKLEEAAQIATDSGPVAAYKFLNNEGHIQFLGPAFFTKWLYFATARTSTNDPEAAPILDAQIISWLNRNAHLTFRTGRTSDYSRYLELLAAWAPHARSATQVEQAIFKEATGRG